MNTGKGASAENAEDRERLGVASRRRNLLARLARRRINYAQVKKIVQFDLPQMQVAFARQFGRRKISKLLRQIKRWRTLLEDDFLVSPELRTAVVEWINGVELFVYQALLERNLPQIGPWRLELRYLPTGEDELGRPVHLCPRLRITATDQKTERQVTIASEELNDPARVSAAYRKAFEKLGLWNLILREPKGRLLVSARRPQAWPVFTQFVIPRLYEYLLPFYPKSAHHSVHLDQASAVVRRSAFYPKELLGDMLDILRAEHPNFFAQTTVSQLKAVIQRYLAKKY